MSNSYICARWAGGVVEVVILCSYPDGVVMCRYSTCFDSNAQDELPEDVFDPLHQDHFAHELKKCSSTSGPFVTHQDHPQHLYSLEVARILWLEETKTNSQANKHKNDTT